MNILPNFKVFTGSSARASDSPLVRGLRTITAAALVAFAAPACTPVVLVDADNDGGIEPKPQDACKKALPFQCVANTIGDLLMKGTGAEVDGYVNPPLGFRIGFACDNEKVNNHFELPACKTAKAQAEAAVKKDFPNATAPLGSDGYPVDVTWEGPSDTPPVQDSDVTSQCAYTAMAYPDLVGAKFYHCPALGIGGVKFSQLTNEALVACEENPNLESAIAKLNISCP